MVAPTFDIGDGLVLAPLSAKDAPSLRFHADNPETARFVPDTFPHPFTLEEAEKRCARQDKTFWGIFVDGEACGQIGFIQRPMAHRRVVEIGIWLCKCQSGKGIAARAMRQIIEYIWETTDAVRIESEVFGRNVAGIRATQKMGLRIESIRRDRVVDRFGDIQDEVQFVLLRSEKEGNHGH